MRTLFAAAFLLLSSTQLAAQIVSPPVQRRGGPAPAAQVTPRPQVYLVTFRPGTPASERASVVRAHGARGRASYDSANAESVEIPDSAVLARLRNDPRIPGVFATQTMRLDL